MATRELFATLDRIQRIYEHAIAMSRIKHIQISFSFGKEVAIFFRRDLNAVSILENDCFRFPLPFPVSRFRTL